MFVLELDREDFVWRQIDENQSYHTHFDSFLLITLTSCGPKTEVTTEKPEQKADAKGVTAHWPFEDLASETVEVDDERR
ncbi:MAG: hypothetical protein ACYTE8_04620 [Planctomycetota bacterium]|jgi:hypothetical protein